MDLQELYRKIIPPNNYKDRKDFYNDDILDRLSYLEKAKIEDMLIEDLQSNNDMLIIETLAYIKSIKSLPLIYQKLKDSNNAYNNIIICWHLYSLDQKKEEMITIAYENFFKIDDTYLKTMLFYYLARFNDTKLDSILRSYINDKDILLRSNAKDALNR